MARYRFLLFNPIKKSIYSGENMTIQSESSLTFELGKPAGLQSRIQGEVYVPGDPRYDAARKAWNLNIDQRPAIIVLAKNAPDISEAVRFARQQGLKVAVQSTGHGVIRPADECLLILTSSMREIQINPDSQTAYIEAGAKWGMVLEKSQAHGLAPLLGSSPDVGVIGYTLGGGMGWLARKYGLATDSVVYFDLVTADGRIVRASPTENSDLFWGLRGGGGSLGIITGMEIQLYPVSTVYGGNLFYPIDQAKEVFSRYRDWIASAPDELTASIVIQNYPPIPEIPEFLRGKSFVMVRGCYCGPVEHGEALLQGWREWQTPYIDDFKTMPFSQVATISNDPIDPIPGFSTGGWLHNLSDEAIDVLIQHGVSQNGSSPLVVTEIRYAGGTISKIDQHANAYGHRDASLILQLIGMTPTPEAQRHLKEYTDQFKSDLQPHMTGGVYMNFLEGEESRARIQDAYTPEVYRRLKALKAKYDPDNLFSFSFNIPPSQDKHVGNG
jgi:hypothetical protein